MASIQILIDIIQRLLGPQGCPWDKEQTTQSLQSFFLDEVHELMEAIDSGEKEKIIEEMGDLLHVLLFYSICAQNEGLFSLDQVIETIAEKLQRRHPHVFGQTKVKDVSEVLQAWDLIKKSEKNHETRKSALDGIPPTLPLLMKGQKMVKKMRKAKAPMVDKAIKESSSEDLASRLLQLLVEGEKADIDLETLLRKKLLQIDREFRSWETEQENKTTGESLKT